MCLLVFKHASAEYATNAFSSKEKDEKLAVAVHVLQTTQNFSSHFTSLFCRGRQRNEPRVKTHVHSYFCAH